MQHNILIVNGGKRVTIICYFKEILFFNEKILFKFWNGIVGCVSVGCFLMLRVTDFIYPELLLKISEENHLEISVL